MPTYEHITHKVTLFGTSFNSNEEWSTSFWLGNTSGGDFAQSPTQAQADGIAALWKTLFESTSAGFGESWITEGVKVTMVGTDGKSVAGETVFSYYSPLIDGGLTGAQRMPPQVALVCTLLSAKPRGYASKGRMYLPGIAWLPGVNGKIDSSQTNTLSTALKTFFDGVNALPAVGGVDFQLVLNSALATGSSAHPADMVPVTGIKVGDVYDTQRRRRNQLVEVYSQKTLA